MSFEASHAARSGELVPRAGTAGPPWSELLRLASLSPTDPSFLRACFELWCRKGGVEEAALYLEADSGFRRELAVGPAGFPCRLEHPAIEGCETLALPGAAVLFRPETEGAGTAAGGAEAGGPEPDGPEALILATAVRGFRLAQQLRAHSFQAKFRGVELEALYDVGLAVTATLDLPHLSEEILLRAVSLLDARRGALYGLEDGAHRLRGSLGGAAAASIAASHPLLASLLAGGGRGPEEILPGSEHLLAVPIEIGGASWGMLVVADKESRRGVGPFSEGDRLTLSLFANQAAIALQNAQLHREALEMERLERDMELAAEIQRQILPKALPRIEGVDVCGWNRPARQVGGDYYDVRRLGENRLVLVLGDVSGKGMPAALLVSTLHSALRLLLDRVDVVPELLERLNRHLIELSPVNKFMTLIMVSVDLASGRMEVLNAGHNPGLVLRGNGTVEELRASGPPLGLLPGASYAASHRSLECGDLLCLYSDGITEASPDEEDDAAEQLGAERLVEMLHAGRDLPAAALGERIDRDLQAFTQGQPQADDQTLLLLSRRSPG